MMNSDEPSRSMTHRDLDEARRDPRLAVGREAMVRDWWAAMKAAERTRRIFEWGALAIVRAPDPYCDDPPASRAFQERQALAQADLDSELAEISAMTLVAMVSALDALVQELTPSVREAITDIRGRQIVDRFREDRPDLVASVGETEVDAVAHALADQLARTLPKLQIKPRGSGASRWEDVLTQVGLGASAGQAVPEDLDHALGEVIQLRHVIAHRATRIDSSALKQAPTLPYEVDQLVRISRDDYRRYSAALWTYGEEILRRLMRDLGPPPMPLERWRDNASINV
jgi:hypothetical protein